jgi:hypothetical protein
LAVSVLYRAEDGTLGFTVASIFLSYVVILEKSLEGFPVSGRREPGSIRFRKPEAMATVLLFLSPH